MGKRKSTESAPSVKPSRSKVSELGKMILVAIVAAIAVYMLGYVNGLSAEDTKNDTVATETVSTEIELAAAGSDGRKRVAGVCGRFGKVFACVPTKSPKGSRLKVVSEDGSARYADGSVFDAEDNVFRKG